MFELDRPCRVFAAAISRSQNTRKSTESASRGLLAENTKTYKTNYYYERKYSVKPVRAQNFSTLVCSELGRLNRKISLDHFWAI